MSNLNLKVNEYDIRLGMSMDIEELKNYNFKHRKGIFKIRKGHFYSSSKWWSKNCEINCFEGNFFLYPALGKNFESQWMCGTSAYLYFRNEILIEATFQLIGNKSLSNSLGAEFDKFATETFGEPIQKDIQLAGVKTLSNSLALKLDKLSIETFQEIIHKENKSIKDREMLFMSGSKLILVWDDGNNDVILEKLLGSSNLHFHWINKIPY